MALVLSKLPLQTYIQYAKRTQYIEALNRVYRFNEAATVPRQVEVNDVFPREQDIDILLGVIRANRPWASFMPPPRFDQGSLSGTLRTLYQREPSFNRYRAAPKLGSLEKQEADYHRVLNYPETSPSARREKKALKRLFEHLEDVNGMVSYVTGRIGQFLQG